MHRRFIATITAAAIAITAIGAAPARADDRDVARALAAILGVAVVGKIIHDNRKDRKRHERVIRDYPNPPVSRRLPHDPYVGPVHPHPKPLPRRVNRKLLPQQCLRSFQTHRGHVRMFGRKCLQRNYKFVRSLPYQCEYRVRTDRGPRYGYLARCLRNEGYRLARR